MKTLLGNQIRDIRKKKAYTQEDLAKLSGISVMSLRRYEANDRVPSLEAIEKIANALEVTAASLIGFGVVDTASNPFWDVDLNAKLKQVGCSVTFEEDAENGERYVWITYQDGGTLEVSEGQLEELHNSTNEYMRFKLEELKRAHNQKFRPKRGVTNAT